MAGKNDLDQSPTQLYEDPDKLTSRGQGNYELTQCPAYESITTKPELPPTQVDQSSHYDICPMVKYTLFLCMHV